MRPAGRPRLGLPALVVAAVTVMLTGGAAIASAEASPSRELRADFAALVSRSQDPRVVHLLPGRRAGEIGYFVVLRVPKSSAHRSAIERAGARILREYATIDAFAVSSAPRVVRRVAAITGVARLAPIEVVELEAEQEVDGRRRERGARASTAGAPQVLTLAAPAAGRYYLAVSRAKVGALLGGSGDFGARMFVDPPGNLIHAAGSALEPCGPDFAADQAMLEQAKQDGDDVAGAPGVSMHTVTAMDYLDSKPTRFLRGGSCYTTVPGINVVAEKHYAWALPIAAGIATNRGGVPWGNLNSVNDVFKTPKGDRDPTMALAHPEVSGGAFTYTAVHEASHYLGLAHPHDSVGATRNADGSPRYYDGFTWAFNSTAAPTTYSHTELVYSILDQESIARGHAAYYLKWADEALAEAGDAYFAAGKTTVGSLPSKSRRLRADAISAMQKAEAFVCSVRLRPVDVRGADRVAQGRGVPRSRTRARARLDRNLEGDESSRRVVLHLRRRLAGGDKEQTELDPRPPKTGRREAARRRYPRQRDVSADREPVGHRSRRGAADEGPRRSPAGNRAPAHECARRGDRARA